MSCCTGRCFLITITLLQLVSVIERLVFDFLGFMWAPIIGNFLHITFVIIGFFGAYQYRPKIVVVYTVWSLIWLGWNIFIICFYLEVGILQKDSPILNIGTENKSWWFVNGIGCRITNDSWENHSATADAMSRPVPPEDFVQGCIIGYPYVEIIHAGVQIILALMGFCVACYVIYLFTEEDDSSQPVHDELEYIKMRYKSPARSSFRDNKTYETLTTRSTYSTVDRSVDGPHGPNYSDDSMVEYPHKEKPASYEKKSKSSWNNKKAGGGVNRSHNSIPEGKAIIGSYGYDQTDEKYAYNIIGQTQGVTVI